ncbi:MAG TPA: hypothetical protein VET24_02225 [Actinomycetota bacterium]|nr:hypothetical protein [Actinomycetota bacterium]
MASTRITIVLEVEHEPEVDLPLRAAAFLERTLVGVEGFGSVDVIRGETDDVVWTPLSTPQRVRRAS